MTVQPWNYSAIENNEVEKAKEEEEKENSGAK